tara:strand:- start:1263 stop:2357 length:1095 start_codon:yes stop_codon:yes gene_type:complete
MFDNVFNNKNVIVTGHTGFKGTWLSLWLSQLGANVTGISNVVPTNPSIYDSLGLSKLVNDKRLDIRNLDALKKEVLESQPDFVFHLAAQPIVSLSYHDPIETLSTNIMGTANLLESLRGLTKKCTSVIITSDKCYDNVEWEWGYKESDHLGGKDIYSGSKGAAELVFKSYFNSFFKQLPNHRLVSARAGNVIGGGDWGKDRIVPDCMKAWSTESKVEIRSPASTRPWQHVLEPISGYLNLATHLDSNNNINGESFNFGPRSDYSHNVKKLINDLRKTWNIEKHQAYAITDDIKFHEASLLKLNCDKALFYLKWLPTLNYEQLINFTGNWYYEFYKKRHNMLQVTVDQIRDYVNIAKSNNIPWTH